MHFNLLTFVKPSTWTQGMWQHRSCVIVRAQNPDHLMQTGGLTCLPLPIYALLCLLYRCSILTSTVCWDNFHQDFPNESETLPEGVNIWKCVLCCLVPPAPFRSPLPCMLAAFSLVASSMSYSWYFESRSSLDWLMGAFLMCGICKLYGRRMLVLNVMASIYYELLVTDWARMFSRFGRKETFTWGQRSSEKKGTKGPTKDKRQKNHPHNAFHILYLLNTRDSHRRFTDALRSRPSLYILYSRPFMFHQQKRYHQIGEKSQYVLWMNIGRFLILPWSFASRLEPLCNILGKKGPTKSWKGPGCI